MAFWVVDVGNTRTAFGRVDDTGRVVEVWRAATPRNPADPTPLPPWPVAAAHAISVVAAARPRWAAAFVAAAVPSTVWWGDDRPIPIAHPYAPPTRPGADRLVAAFAAHALNRRATVVVDAGTALTVDVVDAEGRFLGGAIMPALGALRLGLPAAGTPCVPGLPAPRIVPNDAYPATSTQDAVDVGWLASGRGGVRDLVARALTVAGPGAPLVVTGGDAAPAAAYVAAHGPMIVHELVLDGLARLALAD